MIDSQTGQETSRRAAPQPLPENIRSVQPGGGVCYRVELAWGRWRRWRLRTFRPGYVRKMAQRRQGSGAGSPHEIIDPRDLKYCRNVCDCSWDACRRSVPLAAVAALRAVGRGGTCPDGRAAR